MFDEEGRHLETRDAHTQLPIWTFSYDTNGYLVTVTDRFGDATQINRDATGYPLSILSPDGKLTMLSLDSHGYLDAITDPTGNMLTFRYDSNGLMDDMWDSNSYSDFTFDSGRLTDDDADIEYDQTFESTADQTLVRDFMAPRDTVLVHHTSAEGVQTSYQRQRTGPSAMAREVSWPDGTQTTGSRSPETDSVAYPDGTTVTAHYEPDPPLGANTRVLRQTLVESPDPMGVVPTRTQ